MKINNIISQHVVAEGLTEGPYLSDGPGGVRKGIGGTAKYGMGLGDKRNMNAKNPEIQNDLQGFKSWLNGGPKPADINNMLTGVDTYFTNIEVPSDARVATALKQVLTTKQATPQLTQILNPAVDAAIKAPIRNSASGQQDYLQPGQAPQQAQTQTVAVPVPGPGQAQQPQQAAQQPAAAAATARAAGKKFDTSNATTVTPRPVTRPALPMARLREQGVAEAFDLHAKSTSNTNSSPELRGVYLPGAMKHPDWKEPTWSFQEIAQKLGVSTKELNGLVALYPGFPTKAPGIKSKYGSGAYYPRSEVKRWVNATDIRNILKSKKGMAEGKPEKPEPPEADYGPEYQDMVSRVKKLAGLGPLKTVYDPDKRVYKNVPTAVQPGDKK